MRCFLGGWRGGAALFAVFGGLALFAPAEVSAQGIPEDPRELGSFNTSVTELVDGCDYDLEAEPSIQWSDPPFGYTSPETVTFGDHDVGGSSDTRCPGNPATMIDMRAIVHYPSIGDRVAPGGPFPLVVILHGQQSWNIPGYEGYDYLGELLASHGFVVASIDGRSLMDATIKSRGEHIREHLRRFAERNRSGSLLRGALDMDQVSIIGHSRGGDAVAAAWEWQRVSPDSGYNIAALVAIAPVQFFGVRSEEPDFISHIRDVPYQIIHGSKDGDVSDFQGYRQYDRAAAIEEPGETLKSLVFVKDANHNYFNSVWESQGGNDYCCGGILTGTEARGVSSVYIHSFLQATIKGDSGYRAYLQDARANPVSGTSVLLDFQAPSSEIFIIDHHEIDGFTGDAYTNSLGGEVSVGSRATTYFFEEANLNARGGDPFGAYKGDTRGSLLRWRSDGSYATEIPASFRGDLDPSIQDHLSLRVSQTYRSRFNPNNLSSEQDFECRLVDADGDSSPWLLAGDYAPIYPIWETSEGGLKSVMGSVRFPLSDFSEVDLQNIAAIEVRFGSVETGEVLIDDLRFTE